MWDRGPVGESDAGLHGEHWRCGGDKKLCTVTAGERI